MKPFTFQKADSNENAIQQLTKTAKFLGGGTNLVDLMKKHIEQPELLIDINSAVSSTIETTNSGLQIGAAAKNTAIATHDAVLKNFPLLAKAILKGASPQIRNMASAGGNILQKTRCPYFYDVAFACNKREPNSGCSALNGNKRMAAIIGYSDHCVAVHPSDFAVALAALDAEVQYVEWHNEKVKMNSIPFSEFHRLPDSTPHMDTNLPKEALITNIFIPNNSFHKHCTYLKLRDREEYAFALVSVAAAIELKGETIRDARLASGGVAHKPWRWKKAEAFLKGKQASTEVFEQAAKIASSETKPFSDNQFKVPMLEGGIVTALNECIQAKSKS